MEYLEQVIVIPSCALYEMHLEELVGRSGTIIEIVQKGDRIKGCWIKFPEKILEQDEWFVPYSSII